MPARPSPAGPAITPSSETMFGTKSRYRFMRGNVNARPLARMCSSVAQWWRTSVNVASADALMNDR